MRGISWSILGRCGGNFCEFVGLKTSANSANSGRNSSRRVQRRGGINLSRRRTGEGEIKSGGDIGDIDDRIQDGPCHAWG
jgi:hypothetical protein